MSYYVGLDVSLNSTSICIVDQEGAVLRERKTGRRPEEISRFLKL